MKSKFTLFNIILAVVFLFGALGFVSKPGVKATAADLFISEYVEGSDAGSYNKAIEIYNGTGSAVDLSAYTLELYSNGISTAAATKTLAGTLADDDVWVLVHPLAVADLSNLGDAWDSPVSVTNFNGDDAVALKHNGVIIDVIGQIGSDPGTAWTGNGVSTADQTLVRKPTVCAGDTDGSDAFDPSTEWTSYPKDTFSNIGSHTASCGIEEIFADDIFFSEYIEGSSNNKAIEIYNGTGAAVDLQAYKVVTFPNGSPTPVYTLTWTEETLLADGDVYVIANPSANAAIMAEADITSTVTYYNGDDAVALQHASDSSYVDVIGQVGIDPGSYWGTEPITTVEHTLVRKPSISTGDSIHNDAFDPASEWDSFPQDTFTSLGSHYPSWREFSPRITFTIPADEGVLSKAENIQITFSEAVTVESGWFAIGCDISGAHTAVVDETADPVIVLDPDTDFSIGDVCTVTVYANKVYDDDGNDTLYNYMEADYSFTFSVVPGCGDSYTPIYTIQGVESATTMPGPVTTEGIVVGDFQNNAASDSGDLDGFYIQDPVGDGNPLSSDGIFVYNSSTDVQVGDWVRVSGTVVEFYGITEISPATQILHCGTGSAAAQPISFPLTGQEQLEQYEGMLVVFPGPLTIAEYFNYDRYGQIVLTSHRFMTYTAEFEPSVTGFADSNLLFSQNSIVLDDGITTQNPAVLRHPDGNPITTTHYFRGGDTVTNLTGVMDYFQTDNDYRIQPTTGAVHTPVNTRETFADFALVPGDLKVASFNVLNYFITLDLGPDVCGPNGTMECRGADTADELARQRAKILSALVEIEADVFGLMEIENERLTGVGNAVSDLVDGLNEALGAGTYAYVNTGTIGGDAIKVAIIYKPAKVTPVGAYQVLDSSVDSRFIDTLNRPALAQTFSDNLSGKTFTVAVNHLKSKGSECASDPDLLDGAGNCNLTRKAAAEALVDWLADDTLFSANILIIGDLNSYDKEDPIDMIKLGADDIPGTTDDYLDMMAEFHGEYAYSYVFDGKIGYLDYAMANLELAGNFVDVNTWLINADESDVFDYDMSYKPVEQEALYTADAYRSSDHDPVIITLSFLPEAEDDTYTTSVNTPLNVDAAAGVLANDYTITGVTLSADLVIDVANGTLVFNNDGSFTYTPNSDFHGMDQFVYTATDSDQFDPATVTIYVNDAPVAVADTYSTDEDTELEVTAVDGVLANDSDTNGDTLTAVLVVDVSSGTLDLAADGSFTYMPMADFAGTPNFTYKAFDGVDYSDPVLVTITVNSVNDAPVAVDDFYSTDEDAELLLIADEGTILGNDSDVDVDGLTAELVTDVSNGTLQLESDGTFSYMPDADFNGEDSFVYKVSDGTVYSNEATVTITVNPVNDAPAADAQSLSTEEDTPLDITLTGSDIDGDPLSFSVVTTPTYGTLYVTPPTVTYTPGQDFSGTDSFTFRVYDGALYSAPATISITIQPINDAPVANADAYTTAEDTQLVVDAIGGLLANDGDPDSSPDSLSVELVLDPINGTLALEADGSFTYTPDADFNGEDSFTYKAYDGELYSTEATVKITVNPVNDAPVADAQNLSTDEDTPLAITLTATDIDGDALEWTVGIPAHGSLTGTAPNLTYTPFPNWNGEDNFTFYVNDGAVDSEIVYVLITVNPVNDAPVAVADAYSTDEDTELVIAPADGVLDNDTDVDGDILTAELVDDVTNGTLALALDGSSFIYMPDADFYGVDTFTYKAFDGTYYSEVVTVTITVNPVNDAPVADDQSLVTDEDTPVAIVLTANDVDGDALTWIVYEPTHGTLTGTAPNLTYTPAADFYGEDSFTFFVTDSTESSNLATVTITVNPVNDLPEAVDDAYATDQDVELVVAAPGVLANDINTEPTDMITAEVKDLPMHGTLTLNSDGSFSYVPDPGHFGVDTFTYTMVDTPAVMAGTNWATVTITIHEVIPPFNLIYLPLITR